MTVPHLSLSLLMKTKSFSLPLRQSPARVCCWCWSITLVGCFGAVRTGTRQQQEENHWSDVKKARGCTGGCKGVSGSALPAGAVRRERDRPPKAQPRSLPPPRGSRRFPARLRVFFPGSCSSASFRLRRAAGLGVLRARGFFVRFPSWGGGGCCCGAAWAASPTAPAATTPTATSGEAATPATWAGLGTERGTPSCGQVGSGAGGCGGALGPRGAGGLGCGDSAGWQQLESQPVT